MIAELSRLKQGLLERQDEDGAWRYCFENSLMTDAYMIVLIRSLGIKKEGMVKELSQRLLAQQDEAGCWKIYRDEKDGNLSATVEAYFALLWSGIVNEKDHNMMKAEGYILSKGGLDGVHSMTKFMLAAHGQYPWNRFFPVPVELILLPSYFPLNFMDFSAYARVHLAPMLLLKSERFTRKKTSTPDMSGLLVDKEAPYLFREEERSFIDCVKNGIDALSSVPVDLHSAAKRNALNYMLSRIEPDGSLYSYFSSSFYMIFALLSQGYPKNHPIIIQAIQSMISHQCRREGHPHIQNSPSTIWDTALICHALQDAGVSGSHPQIRKAGKFLIDHQHTKKGDWSSEAPGAEAGGWGFSQSNTINPDVDDTTAALRALKASSVKEEEKALNWKRGVEWVLSMQNKDGGWPAFEKNKQKEILSWVPMDGAEDAALDRSTADLTGRTLEFLGNHAGWKLGNKPVEKGVDWLNNNQERDGSWYGKWGICYIYGTWAALTGLKAAGINDNHKTIKKAKRWLLDIQNNDGGWGESCRSDKEKRYIPLGASTPSQTAWALDALISTSDYPTKEIDRGMEALLGLLQSADWRTAYPTGAGLPGTFYIHYHSYNYIWPLTALSKYTSKYMK
ncbi:squalene--hopene cyclase [Bacillus salacetis]|uniref:Squalene--hopene cyclase n=1 Tax=Bacillus salacetis TaxID=2315464 RepID=A0A3A1R0K4_9BACI|nr:squalene--hopene cyclase [Bacillus salacetis]RIW35064.1 squalene--hopene cyclase [Bacillus salacetis]